MHEKKKYRNIPWNRYNLEKYRDINFWSYRPALTDTDYLYVYVPDNWYAEPIFIYCYKVNK